MEDHAVGAQVHLPQHRCSAFLCVAQGGGRQPLRRNQRGHVLQLGNGGGVVDRAAEPGDERVGAEPPTLQGPIRWCAPSDLRPVAAATSLRLDENGEDTTPAAEAAAVPAAKRVIATTAAVRRASLLANMELLRGVLNAVTAAVNCCTNAAIPLSSPSVAGRWAALSTKATARNSAGISSGARVSFANQDGWERITVERLAGSLHAQALSVGRPPRRQPRSLQETMYSRRARRR